MKAIKCVVRAEDLFDYFIYSHRLQVAGDGRVNLLTGCKKLWLSVVLCIQS